MGLDRGTMPNPTTDHDWSFATRDLVPVSQPRRKQTCAYILWQFAQQQSASTARVWNRYLRAPNRVVNFHLKGQDFRAVHSVTNAPHHVADDVRVRMRTDAGASMWPACSE